MPVTRPRSWWLLPVLTLAGLTVLYGSALRTGFLNDDYLFLEEARHRSLLTSLTQLGPLGNYYRPISRQIYFALLTPIGVGRPLVFHLVNYGVFLGSLALLADLLAVLLPAAGVMAGVLYFALVPLQRVNLTWVSCSQDLLALFMSLLAMAFHRRGRGTWAVVAYALAVFSKESALPLPLLLAAWSAWFDEAGTSASIAPPSASPPFIPRLLASLIGPRMRPFGIVALVWLVVAVIMRARHAAAAAFLHFRPDHFVAAYLHQIQSLLGLDHPAGFFPALREHGPAPLPLLLLTAIGIVLARSFAAPADAAPKGPGGIPDARSSRRCLGFAFLWLAATGFVVGPVAATWSSYYYTLSAVAGALLVGSWFRRPTPIAWLGLVFALLWWHAAGSGVRAFAIADGPWVMTSHLTSFYFERGAALTTRLRRQLLAAEPRPERKTRFFFSTLPPWAGFQMGNGALIRDAYRDPTLRSFFYSQFSESTAADRPCRFLYWNGDSLAFLYENAKEPFFQVGTDLLAFGHPAGALHAFRRGLAAGESPLDHVYWVGWTELWLGRRAAAEAAWAAFGAHDDSTLWVLHMRRARAALIEGRDSLLARRELAQAIRYGIGQPEPHQVLGTLLMSEHPKYGVLELMVGVTLQPDEWLARRNLIAGLLAFRLEDRARAELATLDRLHPGMRDPYLDRIRALLERGARNRTVAEF